MQTEPQFTELAGRIEGIARAVLILASALEVHGVTDGPRLSQAWRESVPSGQMLATARRTMQELADALDSARRWRQEQAGPR